MQITQDFIKGFEEKAEYPTDIVAASAHTAVLVLADALGRASDDSASALRDSIASANVSASTGQISFNQLREVQKDVQIQVVKDGMWRHYAVISDPVLLAPPAE